MENLKHTILNGHLVFTAIHSRFKSTAAFPSYAILTQKGDCKIL